MKSDEKRRDSATTNAVPEGGGAALAAVGALMEERRRFEAWISALEARRPATPDHVFARVHADYSSRLQTVIGQLTTHADGLRRELESMTKRLDVLRDERQRAEDARSEAELRAHVGELSADDWKSTAAESDASLGDIGERHRTLEQELSRTTELLENSERPAVAPEPAPAPLPALPPATAPEPAPASAPQPVTAAPLDRRPSAPTEPKSRESVPSPVVAAQAAPSSETQAPAAPAAPVPDAAPPGPPVAQQSLGIVEHVMPRASKATPHPSPNAIPSRSTTSFDELAFLSSVVDTPSGSIETPPADMPDERTRRDTFARQSQEESIVNLTESGNVPLIPPVPGDFERAPESLLSRSSGASGGSGTGVDGTKTLKCGECSAMNYPTEWYCERCGAELASL